MSEVEFRTHRPGDLGWIIHRHAIIYAEEYGFVDHGFEGHVANLMVEFVANYDPNRERFFIAERDGQILGGILICTDRTMADGGKSAKLHTFFVERAARGTGIGKQLLGKLVDFAIEKGFERISLTTETRLASARRLYGAAGFKIITFEDRGEYTPPGSKLETWRLEL